MLKSFRIYNRNTTRQRIGYKAEIFGISILTVALIFLGWAYIYQETNKYKEGITESFATNQEILVDQVAKSVKSELERYRPKDGHSYGQAEKAAVANVIKKAEVSGSRYWFFYSSDEVIFERDTEETRNVVGKNRAELTRYWKLQGGAGIESFEEMLTDRRNGSAVFSKGNQTGNEIVSVKYFAVEDKDYYLGMSTLQTYVLSTARVSEHILYLWTFSALVSLDILIFSLLLCLRIYKHQVESERLNKSIVDKSLQIQELNRKLTSKSEAVQNASIYDNLTKLYNRKFFDNLLARVNHSLLKPVSIVVMDINGLGQLNAIEGYNAGDELLEKTSEILHKVCIDTDVVARTGGSEFTILMTATKEAEAYGTAKNIKRQFSNLQNAALSLSVGVAQMQEKENSIFTVLEAARKNLILEKMLDENSNSNSIISMMMITLNAYSHETVAHSIRMREIAVSFGKHLGMAPSALSRLAVAAQLHDVGKIGIPDSILNKKAALAAHERDLIRRHSELGYNIVKAIPFLNEAADDILQHHEAYDGTGYPNGLRGEEITLNARIINIIDSFDAMTNESVYAETKTMDEAIAELRRNSGRRYDPYLVNEFIKGVQMIGRERSKA
ncbi:MAG: diguanylate cyclase [Eubacteriales bacterium]|nr:diguanylate cyclase [Eubacteriales bacterium]